MHHLRLASIVLSTCLHAGVVAAALFWPVSQRPVVDLTAPVIDIDVFTIGRPGALSAPKDVTTPSRPSAPPKSLTAPTEPPKTLAPPPDMRTSKKPQMRPDVQAVPIPPQDRPVDPPKELEKPIEPLKELEKPIEPPKEPERPIEPPKEPEKPVEPPKEPEKPAEKAAKPPKKQTRPQRPRKSSDDILREALADLSPGDADPLASALRDLGAAGDDQAGEGGDGVGLVGSYMQSLVSRIKPNWEYAGRADRRNPTAVVAISIAADGTIIDVVVVTSSGDPAFDGSVIKAVRDTSRVEPPPTPDLARVHVPFAYEALK